MTMTTTKKITFTTLAVFTMAPVLFPNLPQHGGLIYYSTKFLLKLALYSCVTVAVTKWIFWALRELCQDAFYLATIPAGVAVRLFGFVRSLFPSKASPVGTSSNDENPAAVPAEIVDLAEEEEEEEGYELEDALLLKSSKVLVGEIAEKVESHKEKWGKWAPVKALQEHLSEDESKYEEYAYSTLKSVVEYYTPCPPKCRETYYLLSEVYEIIEQGK